MNNLNDLYKEFFDKVIGSGVELTPELKDLQQKIASAIPKSEPAPLETDAKLNALAEKIRWMKENKYRSFPYSKEFWSEYDVYIDKNHFGHEKFLALLKDMMPAGYDNLFTFSKLEYSVRNMEFWLLAGGRITIHDVQYLIVFKSVYDKYVICKLVDLYYEKGGSFSNAGLFCIQQSIETRHAGYFSLEEQIERRDDPMRFNPMKYKPVWYAPQKPKEIILAAKYFWNHKPTDNGNEQNVHTFHEI